MRTRRTSVTSSLTSSIIRPERRDPNSDDFRPLSSHFQAASSSTNKTESSTRLDAGLPAQNVIGNSDGEQAEARQRQMKRKRKQTVARLRWVAAAKWTGIFSTSMNSPWSDSLAFACRLASAFCFKVVATKFTFGLDSIRLFVCPANVSHCASSAWRRARDLQTAIETLHWTRSLVAWPCERPQPAIMKLRTDEPNGPQDGSSAKFKFDF